MEDKLTLTIDTELLIKAVKQHPALYKKNDPSYLHKSHHKSRIWQEVCREVVPNYEQVKPQNRIHYGFSLRKRWKSLRTCFSREVSLQKQEALQRKKNLPIKPRKEYGYYKQLSFLLDNDNAENDENEEEKNKADSDEDSYDPLDNMKSESYDSAHAVALNFEHENFAAVFEPSPSNDKNYQPRRSNDRHERRSKGKVIEYLKDIKKEGEDEDKQFLMSLIPTFRKLSDKQKFEARIEILKVLKDISFQSDAGPSC